MCILCVSSACFHGRDRGRACLSVCEQNYGRCFGSADSIQVIPHVTQEVQLELTDQTFKIY